MDRAWINKYDSAIKDTIKQAKQIPVLINYSMNVIGKKKPQRFDKIPDEYDLSLIEKMENSEIPSDITPIQIPKAYKTAEPLNIGITYTHQFYTNRNLIIIQAILRKQNRLLSISCG